MSRGGWNRKVSPEQREDLLRIYLADGPSAAADRCVEMGLCRQYAANIASERGCIITNKGRRLTASEKLSVRAKRTYDDADDPRWAWAIQRGAVLA